MKKSYEVGYCKPPKETQFQKGQSGNSKGRPKKERNDILTLLQKEMHSQVTLADGQRISKEEAMVKQLANKAVKGDIKSQELVLKLQDKNTKRTMAELLLEHLIRRDYLTEDDIKEFLGERKILSLKDLCGSTYCHLTKTQLVKEVRAEGSVIDVIVMSEYMRTAWRAVYMGTLAEKIIAEYEYWQGIDKVMKYVPEEKKKEVEKQLSKGRWCPRPPKDLYEESQKWLGVGKWLILRNWREIIDANEMMEGFEDSKEEFFTSKHKEKVLDELERELPEEVFDAFKANFYVYLANYQSEAELPTAEECQKHILKYIEGIAPINESNVDAKPHIISWCMENAKETIDIPYPRV